MSLQEQLQKEIDEVRACQNETAKHLRTLNQLETQLEENKSVKAELDLVEPEGNVYKLMGPVLMKQDLAEAKSNVAKRLEFIEKEVARYKDLLEKSNKKTQDAEERAVKLQTKMQQAQSQAK